MSDIVDEFVNLVCEKNMFQKKYLKSWNPDDADRQELALCLRFFMEKDGHSLEDLVDDYLFVRNMLMEERLYFKKNGRYRNFTFESVENSVYHNPEYMSKYMCGLVISDYIWDHIKMLHYFEDHLDQLGGARYLEIGPGYGPYLIRAMKSGLFESHLAVDISETSVEKCRNYVEWRKAVGGGISDVSYEIRQANFFDFSSNDKYDCIVMGEVLEHVEDPLSMLQKICDLLAPDGKAFITTVINAPDIDHIYLFSSPDEVLDMVRRAGFSIYDYLCVAEGGISLEKAMEKKTTVDIAMILQTKQ